MNEQRFGRFVVDPIGSYQEEAKRLRHDVRAGYADAGIFG